MASKRGTSLTAREAYFEWSTGHQPETTLREMLDQFGVSNEWEHVLKEYDVHPDVLDITYNEACERPDDELTKRW